MIRRIYTLHHRDGTTTTVCHKDPNPTFTGATVVRVSTEAKACETCGRCAEETADVPAEAI